MTQLRVDQLARQLSSGLSPVYFIHGNETLLINECVDAFVKIGKEMKVIQ